MPPIRTLPPTKPVKTERTHEENQERAYIAASRRSDRSLEARVESARRASEIHKRRTGRSLRVTEQDVINEEMYEEEDDDLPFQYRRLTAHLQTGSADFNRRLAAYLTNHVAMRSALDQAINNSFAQQYPNAPQFAHNQHGLFPSPMLPQALPYPPQQLPQQPQQLQQQPQQQPQQPQQAQPSPQQTQQQPLVSSRSAHPYRQSPYPMPGTPGYRASKPGHNRSVSTTVPKDGLTGSRSQQSSPVETHAQVLNRRMSMPATALPRSDMQPVLSPTLLRNTISSRSSPSGVRSPHQENPSHSTTPQPMDQPRTPATPLPPAAPQAMGPPFTIQQFYNSQFDISPLTMSMPGGSQSLVGPALDPTDSFTSMLLAGHGTMPLASYPPSSFNMSMKQSNFYPSFEGMNTTLAPSAAPITPLEHNGVENLSMNQLGDNTTFTDGFGYNFIDSKNLDYFPQSQNSSTGSYNNGLDADGGWDNFINDSSWTENAT